MFYSEHVNAKKITEATKDKLTVKQVQDFASPCNISNFDGIENSRGWLGPFKKPMTRQLLYYALKPWLLYT